ncbi:hypothetical protein M422DRAFT_52516 [Sphaerobolus stellatus SS14]|uniref:Uncharacterized protein n=1 Tax=Sphaerobolus stellatus (strain SS14) TaxID=990650 RepID=A0A0C9V6U6_SPHS4|nr:hypothetical protein M422DRAFT_52516 [Sphaerobolus stellatus SS14]
MKLVDTGENSSVALAVGKATPTKREYILDSGKKLTQALECAAGLIPVLFVQEAIQVVVNVIQACGAGAGFYYSFTGRFYHRGTSHQGQDDSIESIVKASHGLEKEIETLQSQLRGIANDPDKIK